MVRKIRKTRVGEVVCTCSAYEFPHRFSGGQCNGFHLAEEYWEDHYGAGTCRECMYQYAEEDRPACEVVGGAEKVRECPIWQEFVERNEVKLYGPKYR